MTDDFHFDTEIIIKLHHQGFAISEVPIPTYYGSEICYVNGMQYARDVFRAVRRYKTHLPLRRAAIRSSRNISSTTPSSTARMSSHDYVRSMVGSDQEVLDIGCGEGDFAAELKKNGNRVTGIDLLDQPRRTSARLRAVFQRRSGSRASPAVVQALGGKRFDRVLLLDILEHLRSPEPHPDGVPRRAHAAMGN